MCVVSMVMDHYGLKWGKLIPQPPLEQPTIVIQPVPAPITPEEINEFRELLERAREYDKQHNEPDCELEEKKRKLREIAETLGVKIDFLK